MICLMVEEVPLARWRVDLEAQVGEGGREVGIPCGCDP